MKEQLLERLRPVLSTEACRLFAALLERVKAFAQQDDGEIECEIVDELVGLGPDRWVIYPPTKRSPRYEVPQAFARFLRVCGGMEWGEVGGSGQIVLHDGFGGTVHCLGSDAVKPRAFGFAYREDLFAPIDIDTMDFYLLHPTTGRLCFKTEGVVEVCDCDDPVEIYLREMRHALVPGAPHRSAWLSASGVT